MKHATAWLPSPSLQSRVTPEPEPDSELVAADRGAAIGIAIVSWNVRELLLSCLESLGAPDHDGVGHSIVDELRIVVVDNASSDGTLEAVRKEFPDVTVVANADNRGFTAGNNQAFRALGLRTSHGADASGADNDEGDTNVAASETTAECPSFVMILNPDTEVAPDALTHLVRHLQAHPRAGAVGPLLRYPDGQVQSSRRRFPTLLTTLFEATPVEWWWPENPWARRYRMDDVLPSATGEVDWLNGSAILFRREALADVGGFDEDFFMYAEELDLCRRLRQAGWSVRFEPAAEIVHHEGRSSGQVAPTRHRMFMASRVRYVRKHHGPVAEMFVRGGLAAQHAIAAVIESVKWLVGHRRELRAARVQLYGSEIFDLVTGRKVMAPSTVVVPSVMAGVDGATGGAAESRETDGRDRRDADDGAAE